MRNARWFSSFATSKANSSRSDVDVATRRTAPWLWLDLRCRAKSSRMHTMYSHRCKARRLEASWQKAHWLSTVPGEEIEKFALGRQRRISVHGAVVVAGFAV